MHFQDHRMATILTILYVIGIGAESMSGAVSAGRKNMDLFGVVTIAVITALGGGSIRDMLLGYYPLTWVEQPLFIILTICAAFLAITLANYVIRLKKFFLILDAIGLVTFAYLGSTLAYELTHSVTIAVIMAAITGVSGGMMRDILCNDIPLVFKSELYASIAILVGFAQSMVMVFYQNNLTTTILILVAGFILRLLAIFKKLHLPMVNYQDW